MEIFVSNENIDYDRVLELVRQNEVGIKDYFLDIKLQGFDKESVYAWPPKPEQLPSIIHSLAELIKGSPQMLSRLSLSFEPHEYSTLVQYGVING